MHRIVNNIGVDYYDHARYDEAIGYYRQALRLSEQLGHPARIAMSHVNLGGALIRAGQAEAAKEHLERALAKKEKLDWDRLSVYVHRFLAEAQLTLDARDSALDHARLALEHAQKLDIKAEIRDMHELQDAELRQQRTLRNAGIGAAAAASVLLVLLYVPYVQRVVRPADLVCRWGGGEFMVILPDSSMEDAVNAAHRVQQVIAELRFGFPGSVTARVGVASVAQSNVADVAGLVKLADEALYRAKASGRNRVEEARSVKSGDRID